MPPDTRNRDSLLRQTARCQVTVVGPPEFDKYSPACWTCPWTGPEYDDQKAASDAAREHQKTMETP